MGMVFRKKYRDRAGQLRQCTTWTIRYRRNGKQFEESTGTKLKTKARDLLAVREGDIKKGVPVDPALSRVTFDDAIKAVIDDYRDNEKRSLSDLRARVEKHLTPFFTGRRLSAISTDLVRHYRTTRAEEGAAVATINREVAILKRAFRLAHQAGKVMTIPHIPIAREHNARQGFFEPDQFLAVLNQLPPAFQPVARFAYITGWRWISEILPLSWMQVDFDADEVRLEPGTTKNGEGRTFPFTDGLRDLLTAQRAEHDALKRAGRICPLVFQVDGHPVPQGTFVKAWYKARKAGGQPGRLMHDFRRTAVRNLVRAGVSEQVAMKMTGHKTRAVFDRYDIVSPGDLKDAARKLNARAVSVTPAPIDRARNGNSTMRNNEDMMTGITVRQAI